MGVSDRLAAQHGMRVVGQTGIGGRALATEGHVGERTVLEIAADARQVATHHDADPSAGP